MSDKSDSIMKSIVVAVVIALLVGGSAPWWWNKLFPSPSNNDGRVTPTPIPVESPQVISTPFDSPRSTQNPTAAKGIGACGDGNTPSNEFHNAPASNGSWDWNCDGNVERQWNVCENLSRKDCEPHTNATGAPPGFCTELRAEGGCPPNLGECGKSGWIYPCFYNAEDGRCHAGGYETASVMGCR